MIIVEPNKTDTLISLSGYFDTLSPKPQAVIVVRPSGKRTAYGYDEILEKKRLLSRYVYMAGTNSVRNRITTVWLTKKDAPLSFGLYRKRKPDKHWNKRLF